MKTQIIAILFGISISISSLGTEKRDVNIKSGNVELKGTLYIPKGDGPFPAVVFVHGSGPETRGNSSYSGKWLASIGYVALAYDKRGAGESGGEEQDWKRFSFNTLAADVVAAVDFLSEQKEVDKTKIGIHAASQGGWVAPLAATKTKLISFMIIKSASVSSVGEDRIFERSARLKKEGFSDSDIAEAQEMQLVEAKSSHADDVPDDFTRLYDKNKNKVWFSRVYGGDDPYSKDLVDYRKWYATIVDFNSVPLLEQSEIPTFWIFGDADLDSKGPVESSISFVKTLMENGKFYKIVSYDGEGHNVKEKKYELALYNWLAATNEYEVYKFKKH